MNAAMFFQVLKAELARVDGKPAQAAASYLELAHQTPNDQLYERVVVILLEARDGDTARGIAIEWTKHLPTSPLAYFYLFRVNYLQQQYGNAMPPLRRYLELTSEADKASAITSLGPYFAPLNDKNAVANELIGMLSPFITSSTSSLPTKTAARLIIARAQIDARRLPDALEQLRLLTQEAPDSIEGWLLRGSVELEEQQMVSAEQSFQKFLQLAQKKNIPTNHESYAQAYLGLAQLAENRKDYTAAENWLGQIENDKERLAAQLRRASLLANQGKLTEALDLIHKLPEQTVAQSRAKLFAEVQLLQEHARSGEAIELLNNYLQNNPADLDALFQLSTLYEKAKNYDKMESLLKELIKLAPNHAHAYNALGYSLADRGVRLEEAKTLIEKALTLAPNNASILDSLAWTLFRMGHLEAALQQLQVAYKIRPDVEIGAHMGEVLWMMQRKDEARKVWQEAQRLNPNDATLVETLKRLKVQL